MYNPGITCENNPEKKDAFTSLIELQESYKNGKDQNISQTENEFLRYVNNGECGIKRSLGLEFYDSNQDKIYNVQCAISAANSRKTLVDQITNIKDCVKLKRTLVVYNGIIMDFKQKYPSNDPSNDPIQPLEIANIVEKNSICKLKCSASGGKKQQSRRGRRVKKARRSRKYSKQHK